MAPVLVFAGITLPKTNMGIPVNMPATKFFPPASVTRIIKATIKNADKADATVI